MEPLAAVQAVVGLVPREQLLADLGLVLTVQQAHWAVNTFFRSHFERCVGQLESSADLLVRRALAEGLGCLPPQLAEPSASVAQMAEGLASMSIDRHPVDVEATLDMPLCINLDGKAAGATKPEAASSKAFTLLSVLEDDILLHVFSFVPWRSLASLRATSPRFASLCDNNDTLWREAYFGLWPQGNTHLVSQASHMSLQSPPGCWRAAVLAEITRHRQRTCSHCDMPAAVAPVVYGFPSNSLMIAAERGQLRLGWDYKTPHDPSWMCLQCGTEFHAFPWGSGCVVPTHTSIDTPHGPTSSQL